MENSQNKCWSSTSHKLLNRLFCTSSFCPYPPVRFHCKKNSALKTKEGALMLRIVAVFKKSLIFIYYYYYFKPYLFTFRGRVRERNINVWLPFACPQPGTRPATQACALAGNRTGSPLLCRLALSPLSHTSQGKSLIFINSIYI